MKLTKPGRYFKDGHRGTMFELEVVSPEQNEAWGTEHMVRKNSSGDLEITAIDREPKVWFIDMHQWEPYDPAVVCYWRETADVH